MIPSLALLLMAIGLGIFAYPLLRRREREDLPTSPGAVTALNERYRNALADLQDAETDWQIGNLSAEDYETTRERHRLVAAQALQRLTSAAEERDRVRAELARELASATGALLAPSAVRRPSTNGVHHTAAEVVPVAERVPGRRFAPSTSVGFGAVAVLVAVVGIVGLYVRAREVQANQIALTTLPINHAHTVLIADDEFWVGHHDGLLTSRDGLSWQPALPNGDVMAVVRLPGAPVELALGHDVLLMRENPEQVWRPLDHNLPGTDVHGAGAGVRGLYAYVENMGLFLTRDARAWEMVGSVQREGVNGLAVMPSQDSDDVFVVAGARLLRTRDGGRTWASAAGAGNMALGGGVHSVAADVTTSLLYAGTSDGLYRSADSGSSWVRLPFQGSVTAIAARGQRVALVDEERRFFLSQDGGGTWGAP
jgi:hypothetical protein